MTLITSGYTVAGNQPLTHARILWSGIGGVITATGADGNLAANDYTWQRWSCGTLPATWVLQPSADAQADTLFIAAHNLGSTGCTVTVETNTAPTDVPYTGTLGLETGFTLLREDGVGGIELQGSQTDSVTIATITPQDDSTIAVMFNAAGSPRTIRRLTVTVTGQSSAAQIGIIRTGLALQMERPVFGGVRPIGLSRLVETRHAMSETGQWLGRTIQRQALATEMSWQHLSSDWYRANFDPFARTLPQRPFGLIQNPARMPESVAWCWTDTSPQPENMGVRDFMQVSLPITGFLE